MGRDQSDTTPIQTDWPMSSVCSCLGGPTLAILPMLSDHGCQQGKGVNVVPSPTLSFLWEAGEGCGAHSHAVNDLEEDAAVLELQHGLHGAGYVQTVHL